MNKNQFLVSAAVAGILGASILVSTPASADEAKGHCVAANDCKGHSACKMGKNKACGGKNGCAGKGGLETTQEECKAKADAWAADAKNKGKKNPVHFEAAAPAAAPATDKKS